ncbi:hypothetical protein DTO027B9_4896 [Paecilomyces variotii]|nr:hypothetical protein DTO027B9_4896 [Paecilomyces variotii]
MAVARPRPYRRILTSALHRRFVHASALSLAVCYLVAFFTGVKSSFFWAWFPFGPCGIRTLLLFICPLSVFVLRVGQMHIGARTTSSPLGTIKHLFPLHIIQTFGWYFFSAWWFSEVYVWSSSSDADLGWVKPGRHNERATLNERPIYLHISHILLAVLQSLIHLYTDIDRIDVPVAKRTPETKDYKTHPVVPVVRRIQRALPQIVVDSFAWSSIMTVAGPVIYMLFLRRTAWSYTLSFAKLFWNFPRSAADPPGLIPPLHITLLWRCLTSGALLILLWRTSNLFFTAFIAQGPMKRGQTLTAEVKDPNGSLLNGLKAKKEVVKTFAFWELCLISQQYPERRKAIFSDIDREGGATWTQVLNASTALINGIGIRINEYQNPPSAIAKKPAQKGRPQPTLQTLPQLTAPPKQADIFAPSPKARSQNEKFEETIGNVVKSYGQSPDWTPTARAKARDIFDKASMAMLSPEGKRKLLASTKQPKLLTGSDSDQASSPDKLHPITAQILRSPVGALFRQTYSRRLRGIVLGSPYDSLCSIIDAAESLACLFVSSLEEDPYGKVQSDFPGVVRLLADTIVTLEGFINGGLKVHWTDVTFPPSSNPEAQAEARRVPEVDAVLVSLKCSLTELLTAYKPYLSQVGLAGKDLRLAKQAAGMVEEEA